MFSHIMVGSNDIERSARFYNILLGMLGAGEPLRHRSPSGRMRLFYRHEGSTFCVGEPNNGEPATPANGSGEYAVRYWATYLEGKKVRELDPLNFICYINGTDYLAAVRKALGK